MVSSLLSRRLPTNKDVFALSCLLCAPRGIDQFVRFEVLHGSTLGKGRVLVGVGIGVSDILRCVVPRVRCLLPLEGVDGEALVVGRWVVQDTIHTVYQPRPCLGRARLLPWWQVCRDDASAVDQHLLLQLRGRTSSLSCSLLQSCGRGWRCLCPEEAAGSRMCLGRRRA